MKKKTNKNKRKNSNNNNGDNRESKKETKFQPRSQGLSSPHPKGSEEEKPWFRLVTCLGDKLIFVRGVPGFFNIVAVVGIL